MKRYEGCTVPEFAVDVINADGTRHPLDPRFDIRNHSPTGFAWGYEGSGPAQLALALLCDAADEERAGQLYQEFKRFWVAALRIDEPWQLHQRDILAWIERTEQYRGLSS